MSAPPLKPRRKLRVERNEESATLHDDGHHWAVSYADLLMVLLSFFVVFFSVDDKKRSDLIDQIKQGVKSDASAANSAGPGKAESARLPASLAENMAGLNGIFVESDEKHRSLNIVFKDNLYRPGQVEMPTSEQKELSSILAKLKPFQDKINIVFVGHTDKVLIQHQSKHLKDNFGLSSLRAVAALQYAQKVGMDPARMYTKGVAEHSRGTRTLSLLITPREVDQ